MTLPNVSHECTVLYGQHEGGVGCWPTLEERDVVIKLARLARGCFVSRVLGSPSGTAKPRWACFGMGEEGGGSRRREG